MTTTRTKHAGGTTVEVFDLTPFGFMGFNTNPLRPAFGDPWHLYGYALESAPVASSVAFTGTEMVGQVLTGTYTYSDADGDLEGTTTFQWYRSNDGSGTGKAAIAGATSATYTLVGADEAKYITFGVTPVALTGTTTGTEVQSAYSGAVADGSFVTTWSATSGAKLTIPHTGTGYSFDIDWGDGETQTGLTEADAPFIKPTNYATTETVTITITGTFPRIYFNNGGDKTKILTVENWGSVGATDMTDSFWGCTNLASVAAGVWPSATDLYRAFNSCSALTSLPTGFFGTESTTVEIPFAFRSSGLTSLDSDLFQNVLVTDATEFIRATSVTSIPSGLFAGQSSLTKLNWAFGGLGIVSLPAGMLDDCTSLVDIYRMCDGCASLASLPSGLFDNTPITDWRYAFRSAAITSVPSGGTWDITNATSMVELFKNCTINTTDYNAMLVGWEGQLEPTGINFHGGNSKHSGAGTTARGVLTGTSSWTITDGGAA